MVFNNSILLGAAAAQGGGGFYPEPITQSLKFNDDENQYLSWTPAASGNRKTWTWSGWVKRGNISTSQIFFGVHDGGSQQCWLGWNSGNTIQFFSYQGSTIANVSTQAVFRDTSAWYHLVVAFDAANTTMNMYINGVNQTLTFDTAISNTDHHINNSSYVHGLGRAGVLTGNDADMYLSDVYFIDGQALAPENFGAYKEGVWVKKSGGYTGTFGTNGFYLPFKDDAVVEGFNTVTWRGNGSASTSISGLGFSPDLVWAKQRSQAIGHVLYDSVRGAGVNSELSPNGTAAEGGGNNDQYGYLSSFDSDGFTAVDGTSSPNYYFNESSQSFVAWAWDAGENNAPTGHSSVTYTGTGVTQSIKGFGFEPDLVWIKDRTTAYDHHLFDTVRGGGNSLYSNDTAAENTYATDITFDADGFSVADGSGVPQIYINKSGDSYVAWAWDAGSGSAASNTDGSITSTVKANPSYGFSIVSYTGNGTGGSTIGHGLSGVDMLIIKDRDSAQDWNVYHKDVGTTNILALNSTSAAYADGAAMINSTAPSASVITLGSGGASNGSGRDYIAYCFSEVAGYSKISSYTGTGSAGNAITGLGFRPGFVMIKRSDSGSEWAIYDSSRQPFNPKYQLRANANDAENSNSAVYVDLDSDGFTIQTTDAAQNASGGTYIYMAFKGSYSDYVSDVNTDGTIDSRVKANPATGFSVVSYTGTGVDGDTTGHGLNQAPELMINKSRDTSGQDWFVFGYPAGPSAFTEDGSNLRLNTTDSMVQSTVHEVSLDASVITFVDSGHPNGSGDRRIAYCFHSVAGYSSIGSYAGNGSTSGPTVTTGFKPAFVMFKKSDGTGGWIIQDNTRSPVNPVDKFLYANTSDAEYSGSREVDFLSNGFQIKSDSVNINQSGKNYIYMAFADTREAAFWKDASGNDNNWTPNNLDYRDVLPDSTTNNFATLQPTAFVNTGGANSAQSLSEGNLKFTGTSNEGRSTPATIRVTSGKYYAEATKTSGSGSVNVDFIVNDAYVAGKSTSTTGDIIIVAVDVDAGKYWSGLNGTWDSSGDPATGANPTGTFTANSSFTFGGRVYDTARVGHFNFGQDSTFSGAKPMGAFTDGNSIGNFQYAPPTGFLSLCTENLAEVTVGPNSAAKPIDQFETILYTGNGGTQHIGSGGVQHPIDVITIDNSLRFNDGDSAYLSRTPASAGNRKTWTWSAWVKRGKISGSGYSVLFGAGGVNNNDQLLFRMTNDEGQLFWRQEQSGIGIAKQNSIELFRDPSAWYHIVMAYDSTNATEVDRIKIYVNGVRVELDNDDKIELNRETQTNNTVEHHIGYAPQVSDYFDGYMSDIHFIDGQALDESSFGQYGANGYWIPKTVTGLTYGTNGFALDFSDNSTATALGTDGSGNTNNWTPANLAVSDQMTDSPTQNYAVWNPLDAGSNLTFSEGNLQISSSTNPNNNTRATFSVSSGSWYWENTVTTGTPGSVFGIAGPSFSVTSNFSGDMYGYDSNGNKIINGSSSSYGSTYASGDIIGIAFDADNSEIEFFKNNISQGTITGIISDISWKPFAHVNGVTAITNFGADGTFAGNITAGGNSDANGYGDFKYSVPSGFLALNNDNIPEERGINSPDFVWIKLRNQAGDYHNLFDSVRGATKRLYSNDTNAENTNANTLISFDYDGFTVGSNGNVNTAGINIVSWNWKAGGTAVANTDGSITSQVSANVDAGFSIVSYTGTGANATVGHSLSSAPEIIFVKERTSTSGWFVYTSPTGAGKYLSLHSTAAESSSTSSWNNTAPTPSVFSVGTSGGTNQSSQDYICYAFHSVDGYSKVGNYTGNGSADGTFVYTGFRPAWVMIKRTDSTADWYLYDAKRNAYNLVDGILQPNEADAEANSSNNCMDFTSNGFKLRGSGATTNASGGTYIYLAFAENPFKYSNAR